MKTEGLSQLSASKRNVRRMLPMAVTLALGLGGVGAVGAAPETDQPPEAMVRRVRSAVDWLADDQRQGRGVGTEGLTASEEWLAGRLAEMGAEPAGDDGYYHGVQVPLNVVVGAGTSLRIDGRTIEPKDYMPAAASAAGECRGPVIAVGYGISSADLSHDDYKDLDVTGRIVAVRRFTPAGARFDEEKNQRRFGDLRYKAFNAREHGAACVLVVDLPELKAGETAPDEAPLPGLRVDAKGDAGLPVLVLKRAVGESLFTGEHQAEVITDIQVEKVTVRNVVAKLPGRVEGASAPILVGAHLDHLGYGGQGSLTPDSNEPHNGADDNASGVAAVLEIGRLLAEAPPKNDVWLVGFSAEESGLLGSTALTRRPPQGLELEQLRAMINLDMVGRLRDSKVSVLGAGSAKEWNEVVEPECERLGLRCKLGGDGYGPSDQTPFYAAGIPVLHWFTGTHEDYHKTTDDSPKINSKGVARIAQAVAGVVSRLDARADGLTYVRTEAPVSGGDMRSFGASLGTIPDYAGDDRPGVLLSGARPGSAADQAGVVKGDLLVGLAGREIRNIYDFVYILRSAKPGDSTTLVVVRDGERLELPVTYGKSSR